MNRCTLHVVYKICIGICRLTSCAAICKRGFAELYTDDYNLDLYFNCLYRLKHRSSAIDVILVYNWLGFTYFVIPVIIIVYIRVCVGVYVIVNISILVTIWILVCLRVRLQSVRFCCLRAMVISQHVAIMIQQNHLRHALNHTRSRQRRCHSFSLTQFSRTTNDPIRRGCIFLKLSANLYVLF